MTSKRSVLLDYLEADVTLNTLLPGGVLDANDLPQDGGSLQDIPKLPDGVRIAPFAVVRWRGTTPTEIVRLSRRQFVEIYVYQDTGYDVIDAAIERLQDVLEFARLPADEAGLCAYHYAFATGELPALEYGNAACRMVRFYVDYTRR